MIRVQDAAVAASRYLRRNPGELSRALRNALGLRVGVPLDIFRWLAEQAEKQGKLEDVELAPRAPGIHFAASIDAMHTPVRASATLHVEKVHLTGRELRFDLRVEDVSLVLLGESNTPVAMLIKSGALDLSKPGNLVRHLPELPPFLVDARDNRISIDLMRIPDIDNNPVTRSAIGLVTSLMTIHGIEFEGGHMDVSFRAMPEGVVQAARSVGKNLLRPGLRRARLLLPGRR